MEDQDRQIGTYSQWVPDLRMTHPRLFEYFNEKIKRTKASLRRGQVNMLLSVQKKGGRRAKVESSAHSYPRS
jgi:hypothetical protein